jgi:hypothetical protein
MARSQHEDEVARIVKETLHALDSRKSVVDEHAQRQREQIVRALTDTKGGLRARMELPQAWGYIARHCFLA